MNKLIMGPAFGFLLLASGALAYYVFFEREEDDVKLSDFTSFYICPEEGASQACETPFEISVECVMPGDHYDNYNRDFTNLEVLTLQRVCGFLPVWLETDPRINVSDGKSAIHFYFRFSLKDTSFNGLSLFSEERKISIPIVRANSPGFDFVNPIGFYVEEAIEIITEPGK